MIRTITDLAKATLQAILELSVLFVFGCTLLIVWAICAGIIQ